MINAYKILVRRTEGKRSYGKPRHSWKDHIKTDLKETVRGYRMDPYGSY
jgi:hypothetical protein